ncbi:long-chain-alcohol O-fatty-acyltransferase 5 [Spatholobus suberectus]|nr:long-chain-alcohol O-fatty-acyltransferase 5 [Spatholobus suberectus]
MVSTKCMELEGELMSLIKVWVSVLVSLCSCYFISSRVPKGMLRFVSLCPVLYLFTILPLQLSTVLPTGVTAFFITWLTNFKLLLFTFDMGPLPSNSNSLLHFLSFACLPIRPTPKQTHSSTQQSQLKLKLRLHLPIKALLFGLLLMGLKDHHKQKLHPTLILGLYCTLIYLLLDVLLGLCNVVVNAAFGIELQLPSVDPYFSTSLREFWGRRWNLMVAYILRYTVYIPVRSLLSKTVLGPQWASVPGVMAAFLVSGLMHELIFYYITRVAPTWEVTCFFLLHGACVVVELGAMKWLGPKWRLHWAVSGPITVAFVIATAAWLFFPPLLRDGADERFIKEFNNVVDCIMGKFY